MGEGIIIHILGGVGVVYVMSTGSYNPCSYKICSGGGGGGGGGINHVLGEV